MQEAGSPRFQCAPRSLLSLSQRLLHFRRVNPGLCPGLIRWHFLEAGGNSRTGSISVGILQHLAGDAGLALWHSSRSRPGLVPSCWVQTPEGPFSSASCRKAGFRSGSGSRYLVPFVLPGYFYLAYYACYLTIVLVKTSFCLSCFRNL